MSRVIDACVVALCVLPAGCQQFTAPSVAYQAAQQRVVVETPAEMPVVEFEGFPGGKTGAAALVGGGTFLGCTAELAAVTLCAGPFCPGLVAIVAGICGVAALTTGTVAAWTTPSAGAQARDQQAAATALAAEAMQEALKGRLAEAAARRGILVGADGADTLLEARVTRIGASGNELMTPRIAVRARILRAADRAEIDAFELRWIGATGRRHDWLSDDARALRDALDAGYGEIAEALADRAFLLYPLPDRLPHAQFLAPQFGLAAREPPTRVALGGTNAVMERFEWSRADANPPRLRWQSFPRRGDRKGGGSELERATNVRYDLVIARARYEAPGEIVYRREGLPKTEHRVETLLDADAHYFWSVRARFSLDGRDRVTEWSAMVQRDFESATAPAISAFRFRTP